jgi:large subunit ribosomal protein L30
VKIRTTGASSVTKKNQTSKTGGNSKASASLLVVNLRGLVNTRAPVRTTLDQLKVARRFNATIVPNDEVHHGMLNLAKEHLAWCELNAETAEKLLKMRSERSSGNRVSESEISKEHGSFHDIASQLEAGDIKLNSIAGIRPFFRLSPPRGGFKGSIRRQYRDGGILGPNEELPALVEKML